MPWLLLCVYATLLLGVLVDSLILPPIYWNSSNPMFKTSNNDHIIIVRLMDEIDFVCPHFPSPITESRHYEYYIIYQVSKQEYDDCNIYPDKEPLMMVNCSNPRQRKRFTIVFERYTAAPYLPEFKPGQTYHYITTSTGRDVGLMNQHQGACVYQNMKLTVKVCCDTTTTSTTSPSPQTSPTTAATTSQTRVRWKPTTPRNKYKDKNTGKHNENDYGQENEVYPKKSELVNSVAIKPQLSTSLLLGSTVCLLSILVQQLLHHTR